MPAKTSTCARLLGVFWSTNDSGGLQNSHSRTAELQPVGASGLETAGLSSDVPILT
jgi:hypothetical protein